MINLYIEDSRVDLIGDETIATSYSIAPIADISRRTSFASVTFNLPMTNNNREIFESAEIVINATGIPYRKLKARLDVDGIDQKIQSAELISVKDTYQVKLFGGNIDFFGIIKENKLSDLDLSEYDHEFDLPAILASNANTEGYIYPLIDYQADSPNTFVPDNADEIEIKYLFPCVFVKTLFDKIFEDAGYTVNSTFTFPMELVIPLTKPKVITTVSNSGNEDIINSYWDQLFYSIGIFVPGQNDEINFNIDTLTVTITRTSTGVQSVLTIATPQDVTNDLLYQVNNNPSDRVYVISDLSFTSNALGLALTDETTLTAANPVDNKITGFIDGEEYNFDIDITFTNNAGFTFLYKVGAYPFFNQPVYPVIEGSVDGENFLLNTDINFSASQPDIRQSDFLKAIAQMFGLMYQVDNLNSVVYIRKFDDIIDNRPDAIDWSDKVDYSEKPELTFNTSYAQINHCRYEDDETVIKPTGTDYDILIDNQNLKDESVLFELPFAASQAVTRLDSRILNQIKIYTDADTADEQIADVVDRILALRRENFELTYHVDGVPATPATDDYPLTYFIKDDQQYNVGWANNLINNSANFIQLIQSFKQVTMLLRLTPTDINQLDFFTPVYIELRNQPPAYYYVSEIKQFKFTSESTEVELVKLP